MSRITAITSAMLAIAMLVMPLRASAAPKTTFADESLNYEIVYHWGLIWKHAASNISIAIPMRAWQRTIPTGR